LRSLGRARASKRFSGDQALFLEEPDEDEAREQADEREGVAVVGILGRPIREADMAECPEIPVLQLPVKALVQLLNIERLPPGGMELDEVGGGVRSTE
jgi:hypothetical protein